MRTLVIALVLLAGLRAFADDDAATATHSPIGVLPDERTPDQLRARERNPFTRRETKVAEVVADKESEESKLRGMIAKIAITGVIRGGGAVKVLFGDLILKPGVALPPFFDGQTEQLVVGTITDKQVELNFIEGESRAEPRKILIPIDLRPKVKGMHPALPSPTPAPAQNEGATS